MSMEDSRELLEDRRPAGYRERQLSADVDRNRKVAGAIAVRAAMAPPQEAVPEQDGLEVSRDQAVDRLRQMSPVRRVAIFDSEAA
jgi:hypothetical protein